MPRLADADPPGLPVVITRTQALAAGLSKDQIRQRVRGHRWQTIATGIYRREPQVSYLDPFAADRVRHQELTYSAAMRHPGSVVGIESAAALFGMPLVTALPLRPTLISPIGSRTKIDAAHVHRRALVEDDVMELQSGLWVTTPLRTWVDITRRGHLSNSLAVGDHGLRTGAFTRDDATSVAATTRGRHCRLVKQAAELIDGSRESPLESLSYARFVEWKMPLPQMQVEIFDDFGRLIGRVDFHWEGTRVIGEADGATKYAESGDLYEEKRREDALRAQGFTVVRWGWADLWNGLDVYWRHSRAIRLTANDPRLQGLAS